MAARRPAFAPLSSAQEPLLSAIRDNPAEDTPRLMYADLLQEIGGASNEARAEFIRLQIMLHGKRSRIPDHQALRARARDLLRRHRREWEAAVCVRGVTGVKFSRGFVESLTATTDAFIREGGDWWRMHPVPAVRLERVRGRVAQVVDAPHFDHVRRLHLWYGLSESDMRSLVESRRPGGAGYFPALETLSLRHLNWNDGLKWSASSGLAACRMPRLRELDLIGAERDCDAVAVATAPWFADLKSLSICMSTVGDAGLAALLASPLRKKLSNLEIAYSRVTAQGLHALAELPADPPLLSLSLMGSGQSIYDQTGLLAPDWSLDLDQLDAGLRRHSKLRLDLRNCPISPVTQTALKERFGNRVLVGSY